MYDKWIDRLWKTAFFVWLLVSLLGPAHIACNGAQYDHSIDLRSR